MSLKIQIFAGAIPMLDVIAEANYGQALDALDHAGMAIQNAQRQMLRASTTDWRQFYKDGKRRIYKTKFSNMLGKRVSHQNRNNKGKPLNMANFITSNLMAGSMTMVVGGKHKAFTPKFYRDGQVVGFGKRVQATTKSSYAILQKLDSGSTDGEYKSLVRPKSMPNFESAVYKKQNFIAKGRAMAMPKVQQIMTSKLESMIHKQINRATVKVREVKTA